MIREHIEQQLKDFTPDVYTRCLKIFSVAAMCVILYAFVFSGFQIVDEFEHLHASWLVSIGQVPYKDFFEHHHPLLWYISAPLVSFFYNNAIIFYVMRGFSLLISLLSIWYIYRIVLFFGDRKCAWFAIALSLGNIITLYNAYQFRPDAYMNLFFIMGVYYLFYHLRTTYLKYLIYSFLSFTLSFLFLQKISLLLVVIEFVLLWLIAKKKITFKNAFLASIPTIGVMLAFMFYLYSKEALIEYFELNFKFNQAMVYYFERGAFWYQQIWLSVYAIALLTALYFFKKGNLYFKIFALIYICEFLMRALHFAPHPNYYTLLTYFSAVILSLYADVFMPKRKFISALIITALFINLGNLFNRIDASAEKYNSYKHYQMTDYIHKNSKSNDYLMNGYDKNFNIYRKDVSYYWFGLDMLLPVMKQEYGIDNIDINELVLEYRPKFVYTRNYVDLKALRTYGEQRYTQTFIPAIISSLYKKTPFDHLVVLK